ncbi:hypothetical protein GF326_00800 [Candidatus Bathyarchaeota archaeon]|nr:hypothetical protein [Candidatus Bathyarchaeota archaeon]
MRIIPLYEKGYIFKIKEIRSRYGNILTCLENILLLARNTESMAVIKKVKNNYDSFVCPTGTFDFRNPNNKNCGRVITHKQTFLTKYPYGKHLFVDYGKECLLFLHDLIKKEYPLDRVDDDTLVINIRGGRDIFRKKHINPEYFQPPLSYYQKIIEDGGYEDILLVTDSTKYNPVIYHLRKMYRDMRIANSDTTSQVNVMLSARNLVMARSTFSYMLGRLSMNLKKVWTWKDYYWKWDEWLPTHENCLSSDIKIIYCSTPFYFPMGSWDASKEQRKSMISYPGNVLNFMEQ